MRKRVLIILLAIFAVLSSAFALSACEKDELADISIPDISVSDDAAQDERIKLVYEGYVLFSNENGVLPLNYEEWLESVKGADGVDGKDGATPTVEINEEGFWVINGQVTLYKAVGEKGDKGDKGEDGLSACGSNDNTDEYDEILKFIPYGDNAYAVTAVETEHLENIVIPAKYRNKPVTRIATKGFNSVYSLVEIVIPDSVTSIGDYAFSGCNKLTRINIPDSVKVIDDNAFYNCRSLTSVTIGNGVTSIGNSAFYSCASLTSVYYGGTESDWAEIGGNYNLRNAAIYYFSETEPTESGNYWHYDADGVPAVWQSA